MRLSCSIGFAMLLCAACSPADVASGSAGLDEAADPCTYTSVPLTDLVADPGVGFSPAQVIDLVAGSREAPIFWHETFDAGVTVTVGPERGESRLFVEIAAAPSGARLQRAEPQPYDDACSDVLEIDVQVQLSTAGGGLQESFVAPLHARVPDFAELRHAIPWEQLVGTQTVAAQGEVSFGDLDLRIGISPFGIDGTFATTVMVRHGSGGDGAVGAGRLTLATFPAATSVCEGDEFTIAATEAPYGASVADAVELVASFETLALLRPEGTRPTLEAVLVPHGEIACARASGSEGEGLLRFSATLELRSEDGLDGRIPVDVIVSGDGSSLTHVGVSSPAFEWAPVEAFAATYGTFGIALDGYQGGMVEVNGAFAPSTLPGSADGAITVSGVIVHECSSEPGAPCAGVDREELARIEWSN